MLTVLSFSIANLAVSIIRIAIVMRTSFVEL